jgi:hypothetical protein
MQIPVDIFQYPAGILPSSVDSAYPPSHLAVLRG